MPRHNNSQFASAAHAPEAASSPRRSVLLAILAIGCFLRIWNLGVHSFWHDEGATLYLATAADPIDALRGSRHPPIAIFVFRWFISLFGEEDATLRLLPALLSCGSLFIFTYVARRFCAGAAATLAIALYAVAPFQIWYAGEVTPYAFLEFGSLVTLAGLAGTLLNHSPRWFHYILLLAGPAFAFGSQYMGWLAGATVAACALIGYLRNRIGIRAAMAMAGCAIAAGLIWIPWLLTIFREQQHTVWGNEAKLSARQLFELPTRLLLIDMSVIPDRLQWAGYLPGLIIYVGLTAHVLKTIVARRFEDIILLAGVVAPLAGALALMFVMPPNFLPRYLTPAAPALACAVASGLMAIPGAGAGAGSALCAVFIIISVAQKLENRREDYRTGCDEILQMWNPGDRVFVITGTPDPFAEAPARHYLRARAEIVQSIEHAGTSLVKLGRDFPDGAKFHVLYREREYSKQQKGAFDSACKLLNQSADRFGIRRLRYEVKK
ncbi:MAG: glycosyltransferase family 39 protein [Planctomycetes bacterium]|nr:glycosyltransferase family 39 protein [Planctomycetota bacterium]